MRRFLTFFVGFAGGSFLIEMVTKSYPKFGSIFMGLVFGLLFMELEKKEDAEDIGGKE